MRCYICNVILDSHEIEIDDYGKFLPCTTCLETVALYEEEDVIEDTLKELEEDEPRRVSDHDSKESN